MPFTDVLGETNCGAATQCIFDCINLARRLKPGSRPWRAGTGYSGSRTIVHGIEAAKPYIRFIIKHGDEPDQKKLAVWLLKEARALKIEVPAIVPLPPKPYSRPKKIAAVEAVAVEAEMTETTPRLRPVAA